MRKLMAISEETSERSRAEIDEIFSDVSAALRGRQFLVGDRFTAADLTFASLAGPLLNVPELGGVPPVGTRNRAVGSGAACSRAFRSRAFYGR